MPVDFEKLRYELQEELKKLDSEVNVVFDTKNNFSFWIFKKQRIFNFNIADYLRASDECIDIRELVFYLYKEVMDLDRKKELNLKHLSAFFEKKYSYL